jgi:hypothetical protein
VTGTNVEQRRLQMLEKQKERVARELALLEAEVESLVGVFTCYNGVEE